MDVTGRIEVAATILVSLGGARLIVLSFASWLGKVWANRILELDRLKYSAELERLRGELSKTLHVHRQQFETEFRVLCDIWAKLSNLRSAIAGLRPTTDIISPDESSEDRLNRRLTRFNEAFDAFVRVVDDQSPFYPEDIFQELSVTLQSARRESISVSLGRLERTTDWSKKGAANFEAFRKSADKVSPLIRNRFTNLQIRS